MRFILLSAVIGLSTFGCAPKDDVGDDSFTGAGDDAGGGSFDIGPGGPDFDVGGEGGPTGPCIGLQCQQVKCEGGGDTTVTGTVYAPNGKLPLYNVQVYVPNAAVAPLDKGASCDKCGAVVSGDPVVTAITDSHGKFTLKNVPAGANIPLVIQLGKWRRETTIPMVTACTETKLTNPDQTRLPKKQSEGNMPRIAVTVGGCDKLSCMLPKVGIDASEFGVWSAGDSKKVHFYEPSGGFTGGGAGPTGMEDARKLWSDTTRLKYYDLVIFSCECYEAPETKDATSYKAVADYLAAGGRIFTTDYQYTWYKYSPDAGLQSVASIPGGAPLGGNPAILDTSFPKGKALADWLAYVDKSTTPGQVKCDYVFNNFSPADKTKSQTWASSSGGSGGAGGGNNPRFITINTPVGKPIEQQCGKAVHLDAHINQSDTIDSSFPAGCSSPIKEGEEAFAFFFFDLAACIQKDGEAPKPPPIK
ncbi:MAG: carboxypeptidase regulatory-like domain-containing protein [Polyangiales bacterium]